MVDLAELMEEDQAHGSLPLWPTSVYILSMTSMVWNISLGQLGLAAWLCCLPALVHLIISPTQETEKRSLISLQQLKSSVYYQHSSHNKFKTQQLLGRKIIQAETGTQGKKFYKSLHIRKPPR